MDKKAADKKLKCCVYARVSTDEQAERDLSIPFQLERCRYHAQGKGWEVVREFVDAGESARTDKRPEFQKMIAQARNKAFDIILVHKFDRFARNDYDFIIYEKELEDLKITVESVSEPGDASTPAGYISRRMMQIISTWYSKNLAIEVKKGLQKKVENGGWPKQAPFGYLNKHDKNSAWIEVDPRNGSLVTEAFKEMASGRWTLQSWSDESYVRGYISRLGNQISRSKWSDIFHNRFYLGETWLKKGDVPTKGAHQPLVDEDTFTQVQQILRLHDKNKQRTRRHKYLLQGLVHSVDADSVCWAETHPTKRISYYRSREKVNGSSVFYNTRDIEEQLPAVFKSITITEEARQDLRKELEALFKAEANGNGELSKAEARLVKLARMEKNLQRLVIEEQISYEDFKEHRAQIEAEKSRLKNTVDAIRQRQHLIKADFEVALELATQLDFLFDKGTFDEKRLICETVFKCLYVEEGKVTKAELNAPFAIIASRAKGSGAVPNGGLRGTIPRTIHKPRKTSGQYIKIFSATFPWPPGKGKVEVCHSHSILN
ncbi:MAG: recombinase family protein [Dehalococcoidales bacterium]|nr:recombinase family protein [Dehalococcoidales bacterium]